MRNILYILLALYPVLPSNYHIGPLGLGNACSVAIVLVFFIYKKARFEFVNIINNNYGYWQYIIFYVIISAVSAGVLVSATNLISLLLVSFVFISIVKNEKNLNIILNGIIITAIILALIGCFESFSGHYVFQETLLGGTGDNFRYGIMRCAGPFGNPIIYGLYQSIATLITYYQIKKTNKKRYKVAYIILALSIFLAVSRLSICFFLGVQLILILKQGVSKAVKTILVFILSIIVLIIFADVSGFETDKLLNDFFNAAGEALGNKTANMPSDGVGFGNRFDLYAWVIDAVGDNWLLGNGVRAEFMHVINPWTTKTSIEVHYLYVYFHCGIIGLILLIISYISNIQMLVKNILRTNIQGHLSFSYLLCVIFLAYYICLFGVQEVDLSRFYCELVSLGIAYTIFSSRRHVNA